MPEGYPAYLREVMKDAVKDRNATLALWICAEIRHWDLLIGETPARTQQRKFLPHSGYDCMCHYEGCLQQIRRGEPIWWDPDHGNYHAWHWAYEPHEPQGSPLLDVADAVELDGH